MKWKSIFEYLKVFNLEDIKAIWVSFSYSTVDQVAVDNLSMNLLILLLLKLRQKTSLGLAEEFGIPTVGSR